MRRGMLWWLAFEVVSGCHASPVAVDGGGSTDAATGPGCPTCTVFINGTIFDGVDAGVGIVVVQGTQVIEVVYGATSPGPGTVVDLTGQTILPGLIDAHTHLFANAGPRGWSGSNDFLDAHLKAFLRSGVTTLLDLGSPAMEVFTYRARIQAGQLRGPNLFAAGPLLTPTGGHPCYSGTVPGDFCGFLDQPSEVNGVLAQLLPQRPDVIKLVLEPGIPGDPLPELTAPVVAAVQAVALDAGLQTVMHVFDSNGVQSALAEGITSLAHVPGYDLLAAGQAAAIADAGATVIPTLSFTAGYVAMSTQSGPWVGDAGPVDDVSAEVLAALGNPALVAPYTSAGAQFTYRKWQSNQQANFKAELAAGVHFVAGTDCGNPADFHGLALAQELAQYVSLGMTPLQALQTATSASADWLRHPELGHLRAGARADVLVVDGDATSDITALAQVARVYKDGVLLDRNALSVRSDAGLVLSAVTDLDGGAYCLEPGECATGLICPLSFHTCVAPCDAGACALGAACTYDSAGGPDFCWNGDGCNPLTQNCVNAAACLFLGNAATACNNAGGAAAGQACGAEACVRGAECYPQATCSTICDPSSDAGCSGLQTCMDEEAFAGIPVGVCE
jgi:imidazolonepropionase-like amidohydrolase